MEVAAVAFQAPTQPVLFPFVLDDARPRLSAPRSPQSKPLFSRLVDVQRSPWLDQQQINCSPSI